METTYYNSPQELLKAYKTGLPGVDCDMEDLKKLLGELPEPMFGVSAYQLYGDGKGKISLPFKSLQKFDPEFGPHERQTTGDCFDGDTIVISEYCKKIKDVNIGDKIYTSDGKYTNIISKQIKISNNPLITIKTKGSIPLSVTSDHQVMIGRKIIDGKSNIKTQVVTRQWVNAQDIKKGDYIITPINIDKDDKPINNFTIAPDFDWFFGYFLGDGWCDYKSLEITFAQHQTELFQRCSDFLSQLGFNVKKCDYKSKNTTAFRLRCWCPELATFLRNMSYNINKHKVFPSWAIGNKEVVKGLIESDGFVKDNKEIFDSSSISLSYGMYYSYLSLGYKPTISYFHRAKKGAYKDTQSYRVTCIYDKKKNYSFIKNNELYIQVSDIYIQEGPHEVYDIGVADISHAFLANGCIAHNCVAHSTRNAVDITRAVEIDIKNEPESFETRSAVEAIYQSRGHRGQGMSCSGAARYVHQNGGILLRKNYGAVDLSKYNSRLGANHLIPSSIYRDEARKHQVLTISLVRTIAEARDAISNGYAISVCSGQGFSSRRDKYGIAAPSGSWAHAMAWIGCDDSREIYNETLFLVQNSWGLWNSGPKRLGQPDGSFWIREKVARDMLAQNGAWVFSNVRGFPARKLPDYGTQEYL